MIISETKESQLDTFLSDSIDFLKNCTTQVNTKPTYDLDFISMILNQLAGLADLELDSANLKVASFPQRTIYEYTTTWVFLSLSSHVKKKHFQRYKSLLLIGSSKYIKSFDYDIDNYLKNDNYKLTEIDERMLNMELIDRDYSVEFSDRLYKSLISTLNNEYYKSSNRFSFYDKNPKSKSLLGFLHMLVHGNPFSIAEVLMERDKRVRNKIMLSNAIMQTLEYLSDYSELEDRVNGLRWKYHKFSNNLKFKIE